MRESLDGIVRQEWPQVIGHPRDDDDESPPAVVRAEATPALKDVEAYAAQWDAWLTRRSEEDADAVGADEAAPVDPLLVEGLAALQRATDQTFRRLERELTDRFAGEAEELRAKVSELEDARRADAERHRAEVRGLCAEIAGHRKAGAAAAEQWRSEATLLQNEVAELRATDRLRASRAGQAHKARVELKLVRAELEREAKGAA